MISNVHPCVSKNDRYFDLKHLQTRAHFISPVTVYTSYRLPSPGQTKLLLLDTYVRIVALTPDLQKSPRIA